MSRRKPRTILCVAQYGHSMLALADLRKAADDIHRYLPQTPQYAWPLLARRLGTEVWTKHENHLPTGAFKVRGGISLMSRLQGEGVDHVVAATRGNHGQSIAWAAQRLGMTVTIVVPHGNSPDKNASMEAMGGKLLTHGHDFQQALECATGYAQERGIRMIPSFCKELVQGVASYSLEFLENVPELDRVYVPIGLGSGICGMVAVRNALGLRTKIIGVVAEKASCYADSFRARSKLSTAMADTFADGIACRTPNDEALECIMDDVSDVIAVSEHQIEEAMRALFSDTHNIAEGAGAASLAGALAEKSAIAGLRVGIVLTGGNVDRAVYGRILQP